MVGSPEQAMVGSLLAAAAIRRPHMAGCADRIAFIGHERAVEASPPALDGNLKPLHRRCSQT